MSEIPETGAQGPSGGQGIEGPSGKRGQEGIEGPTGAQGVEGQRGIQGPSGGQGVEGPRGQKGSPGTDPVTQEYTAAMARRFLRVVVGIEALSIILTVIFVVVVLGIANQGEKELAQLGNATLDKIDSQIQAADERSARVELEVTQLHYFDTCTFLVLTKSASERTPKETRDIILTCHQQSLLIDRGETVRNELQQNYPGLLKASKEKA